MIHFTFYLRSEVSQNQLGWLGRRGLGWMAEMGHPRQRFTAFKRFRYCYLGGLWTTQNVR